MWTLQLCDMILLIEWNYTELQTHGNTGKVNKQFYRLHMMTVILP